VSGWTELAIVVIAIATLATAIVQITVLVAAGRLARRVERLVTSVEQEVKPMLRHLDRIGQEASRAAALTSAQIERVDTLFAGVLQRIDQAVGTVHKSLLSPVREGAAVMSGVRAAFDSIRRGKVGHARPGADGEDVLFI
jgi:uncharacterized protein YoxC